MPEPQPQPVQSLEYSSRPSTDAAPRLMRAFGYVIAAYGLARFIGDGAALFEKQITSFGGGFSALQYFWLATASLSIFGAAGAIAGGLGCIARRPWARYLLLLTAIFELIWRITIAVQRFYRFGLRDLMKSPDAAHISNLISQTAYTVSSLVLATVLLVIVRNKKLWVARDPA